MRYGRLRGSSKSNAARARVSAPRLPRRAMPLYALPVAGSGVVICRTTSDQIAPKTRSHSAAYSASPQTGGSKSGWDGSLTIPPPESPARQTSRHCIASCRGNTPSARPSRRRIHSPVAPFATGARLGRSRRRSTCQSLRFGRRFGSCPRHSRRLISAAKRQAKNGSFSRSPLIARQFITGRT